VSFDFRQNLQQRHTLPPSLELVLISESRLKKLDRN
jgi:hypothetical protein